MNLNNKYFLKRYNNKKTKKQIYCDILPNQPMMTLKMNKNNYINNNSHLLNNTIDNNKIKYLNRLNNSSVDNSLHDQNKTQINQDIIGYNNYIINTNTSLNSIDVSILDNKKKNSFSYNKNFLNLGLANYVKNTKVNNLKCLNNTNTNGSINTLNNSSNYNSNLYNDTDIEYMNMKLNFKLLEQKISQLNNIILPNTETNHLINNININNIHSNYDSYFINEYPTNRQMTDIYSNSKMKKYNKKREIDDDNYEKINNLDKNRKIVKSFIYNLKNKQLKNKNNDNKYENTNKENNIINKNNRKDIMRKNNESDNLSEIADNLLDILHKKQEKQKQKDKITDEIANKENEFLPFKMPDEIKLKSKFLFTKKKINIKKAKKMLNNNYINNTEYTISNLPEIFYKSNIKESYENNINNNNQNHKNNRLIVEHVFDYNHSDNNKIKENNDAINIFNKMNLLSRNTNKHNKENRAKKNSKDKKHLYNEEIIIINNNNDRLNSKNSYDKYDEEGEKVINSLIAQASRNNPNEEEKNIDIKENNKDNPLNKIPNNIIIPKNINNEDIHKNQHEQIKKNINKKHDKKVSFDENLIYINYNQNNRVINFNVSNQKNKFIQFKPINISKYLKILSSDTEMNKLKPVILNTNKINVNDIINEITKEEENKKNKSNNITSLKNKITQRNIDFIKIVQERGTVYNISKEKARKKVKLQNCKKFEENPQHFFTEKLCDNILESYNIHTKNKSRSPSSSKKNNNNTKKENINKQ